VHLVNESPVTCIGVDTEYRFLPDEPIRLKGKKEWFDIRSCQPFCAAIAVVSLGTLYKFAIDLRDPRLRAPLQRVLDLPVSFVFHNARADLFALWSVGIREPNRIWDSYVAERALRLGNFYGRPSDKFCSDEDEAEAGAQAEQVTNASLSLSAVAAKYGFATAGSELKCYQQQSFLTKPFDAPLSTEELEYCAADAEMVARLREPQRIACDREGLTEVLDSVVMPWVATTAETEWTGVLYDREACDRLLTASEAAQTVIKGSLRELGIGNPRSAAQIGGLDSHFPKTPTGNLCTNDSVLKDREHLHPGIRLIRRFRKICQMVSDPAVCGHITGKDGRVHARLNVLGAESGRTQSSTPNLMGIGRIFRPLIVTMPGRGVGDVDLSQIEVGIAAAVFDDSNLISDFNGGDVYVAMAKRLFGKELDDAGRRMSEFEFKRNYGVLRDRTKPLWLGIFYGMATRTVAARTRLTESEAEQLVAAFRSAYPTLCERMDEARRQSFSRGYAYVWGLRRYARTGASNSPRQQRALGNAYVQGTAAIVFCAAGNRLRQLYRQYDAHLLVPVHDAFVFESPAERLADVAELTKRVMTETVQEWFPALRPRAEINTAHPECWNYEGHADSVDRFLADPTFAL
jgi:DNA polymerase-1